MDNKICELECVIHELESLSDSRQLNEMEVARLKATQSLLHSWLIRRERVWRHKARSYGLCSKDHNSKYFHASTIFRRKKKEIVQIKINGSLVSRV